MVLKACDVNLKLMVVYLLRQLYYLDRYTAALPKMPALGHQTHKQGRVPLQLADKARWRNCDIFASTHPILVTKTTLFIVDTFQTH